MTKLEKNCFDRINEIYWINKIIPLSRIIMLAFLDSNPINPVKISNIFV